MEEELYTVAQVADRLKVTRRTVREWLRTNRLRAVKAGHQWRITASDLQAFLQRRPEAAQERL
jgi:excisionase family DNA binding protein